MKLFSKYYVGGFQVSRVRFFTVKENVSSTIEHGLIREAMRAVRAWWY